MNVSRGVIRSASLASRRLRAPVVSPASSLCRQCQRNYSAKPTAPLNGASAPARQPEPESKQQQEPSNPALSFPCLDAQDAKTASLSQSRPAPRSSTESGPEPSYTTGHHESWTSHTPLFLDWGGVLREFTIAYETWGTLNVDKNNAILLLTGLSASSHARSTPSNPKPGWWERFIGPGAPLDTDRYFVICTNVLGSCFGSTGPSSLDPSDGRPYATRFPILTVEDMVRAQFRLLDAMGIERLAAAVGSSMGGMQSLAAGVLFPDRVAQLVSISGCARSHPYSIAMRHTQRQVLMMDPSWRRGFYYDSVPPHSGMKLAREIATVTYRSGPEWQARFGRRRADPARAPALCPDFLIETYLDHAGEKFSLSYDANSLLYVSKAMDLFDLGAASQRDLAARREENRRRLAEKRDQGQAPEQLVCSLTLPAQPYEEQEQALQSGGESAEGGETYPDAPPADLVAGLGPLKNHRILVMGVSSDSLFPAWQQREVAAALRAVGNRNVRHVELGEDVSLFGHDTFLLDLENIGGPVGEFLAGRDG